MNTITRTDKILNGKMQSENLVISLERLKI